ncbi:MAG TPA: SMC-Scp complex subunit ScpB [Terracidiphilus sp.]|jgi:segregation and condensation protein B
MSLKAKLEAVIYAAEEPVTLAQLAQIFAADALEWQAVQAAAAAEANADMAGEDPASAASPSLLPADLEILPVADTAAMTAEAAAQAASAAMTGSVSGGQSGLIAETGEAQGAADQPLAVETTAEFAPEAQVDAEPAAGAEPGDMEGTGDAVDPEAEARRLARQRDREIRSILKQILDEILAGYENDERGIEIREIAGGYRMATKPECHDAVRLFVKSLKPPMKLSLPALETLAVVAYKQPATAPEVSEIRGVESGGVLGSLLARKLIATAGRKQVIGRPILYKTTKEFLLRFGLKDLNELPSMEEFEKMAVEIEEMEPEAVAADAAQAALEAAEAAEPGGEAEVAAEEAGRHQTGAGEATAESNAESIGKSGQEAMETPAELEGNSPSGLELAEAETAEAPPPQEPEQAEVEQASEESTESPTDATSAEPSMTSNEQDAGNLAASEAPPAQPDIPVPAENEGNLHAEKAEEEHGA